MTDAPAVIGLGEALWDCFPDRRLPGGAPANVAFHAQQLGLTAAVATRVGNDSLGDELCEFLRSQGLSTDLVQRDSVHGTGTVTVEPRASGNTKYTFLENSAWDFLEVTPDWRTALSAARAVCFGTLAQRGVVSRAAIHDALRCTSAECLIVYDINLRPPFYERDWIERSLAAASIVKLNDDEVRTLRTMFSAPAGDDAGFANWLRETWQLDAVCVTRGGNGAVLVADGAAVEVPGVPIRVADTVGAGDAFTASVIWGRLSGWPWDRTVNLANRVGALVASRSGAMPPLRAEFSELQQGESLIANPSERGT